jgi:hypothetical protein
VEAVYEKRGGRREEDVTAQNKYRSRLDSKRYGEVSVMLTRIHWGG